MKRLYKKLDKRMLGYGTFKYGIDMTYSQSERFVAIRDWCWEQWGPSSEMDFYEKHGMTAPWAWVKDQYRIRIYFMSDKELSNYLLRWS